MDPMEETKPEVVESSPQALNEVAKDKLTAAEKSLQYKRNAAFNLIKQFLSELWKVFGDMKKEKAFALYTRLISNITVEHKEGVDKVLKSMKMFLIENEAAILSGNMEKLSTSLIYNERANINVNIKRYYQRADDDIKDVIKKYILTINAVIFPKDQAFDALEKDVDALGIDRSTPEGKYISNALRKVANLGDLKDPQQAVMLMLSSGVLEDVIKGAQRKIQNGTFTKDGFTRAIKSCIGTARRKMKEDGEDPDGLIKDMVKMMGGKDVDLSEFGL